MAKCRWTPTPAMQSRNDEQRKIAPSSCGASGLGREQSIFSSVGYCFQSGQVGLCCFARTSTGERHHGQDHAERQLPVRRREVRSHRRTRAFLSLPLLALPQGDWHRPRNQSLSAAWITQVGVWRGAGPIVQGSRGQALHELLLRYLRQPPTTARQGPRCCHDPCRSLDQETPIKPQARVFSGSRARWSCEGDGPEFSDYPPQ